jgi:YD repeat-containing protein
MNTLLIFHYQRTKSADTSVKNSLVGIPFSQQTGKMESQLTHTYDSLKRKTAETSNGISILYTYDASGKLIITTRQGTNATQMLQHGYAYDLAGRLIAETNGVGVVTTYSYGFDGSGQTLKTITYASGTTDSSTRIETYAKDGALLSVVGTGVNPVRYTYGVEQDGGVYRLYKQEIKLDVNGQNRKKGSGMNIDIYFLE